MDTNLSYDIVLLKARQTIGLKKIWCVERTSENDFDIEDEDFLVFHTKKFLNENQAFYCEKMNLPYDVRKALISKCTDKNIYSVSQKLFQEYVMLSDKISFYLASQNIDVYVFCCVYNADFCLISPFEYDFKRIRENIDTFLKEQFFEDANKDDNFWLETQILNNELNRLQCIKNDRKFVKYNPNFYEYFDLITSIQEIDCDSSERKTELSLFASLILKDLVEETHAYWIYESGEVRRQVSDINHIIFERDSMYFKYFKTFCSQADINYAHHDWIWCLVFLTGTLLASLMHRSFDSCKPEEISAHSNFFGFIPVIEDDEDNSSEVMSLYTRHISKMFCHGFLVIPKYSVYNLPEFLPAYIHEFFHYIPPRNREKRNEVIFQLVLHSVFNDLRSMISPEMYKYIIVLFSSEIIKTSQPFGFDEKSFYECDSMEYLERIRNLIMRVDFGEIYDIVTWNVYKDNKDIDVVHILITCREKFVSIFKDSALSFVMTFAMFCREIRSDIAMCSFFDMSLSDYIEVLAREPLFSVMSKSQCADSTIMRFGFMCRYLTKDTAEFRSGNWKNLCKDTIDGLISQLGEKRKNDIKKYSHLKDYLDEYEDISIELSDNQYTPKGQSFLENILSENSIISKWEDSVNQYVAHSFSKEIKTIYRKYKKLSYHEKKATMCGIKFLFRDLYLFDPNLDKD